MARQEHAREDLLAEARALVERIEIVLPDGGQHIVLGFRRDGAASVYFDEDPAYHFNSRNELRRAYLDGQLLKAESGRLISITRERTADRVQLTSRELDVAETAELLGSLQRRLARLSHELDAGRYQVVGQVPPHGDVLGRVRSLLAKLAGEIVVAASLHAG